MEHLLDQSRLKNLGTYLRSRRKAVPVPALQGRRDAQTGRTVATLPSGGDLSARVITDASLPLGAVIGSFRNGVVNDRSRTQ